MDGAILEIAPTAIRDEILTLCDVDFMYEIKGCSRFRINYNRQLGLPATTAKNYAKLGCIYKKKYKFVWEKDYEESKK